MIDDAGWSNEQLGNVLRESPRNGLSPKREVENGGRPMLRINAVSSSPTRFVDLGALKWLKSKMRRQRHLNYSPTMSSLSVTTET